MIRFDGDANELVLVERREPGVARESLKSYHLKPTFAYACQYCEQVIYAQAETPGELNIKQFSEASKQHMVFPEHEVRFARMADKLWMTFREKYHFDFTDHYHHVGKCPFTRTFGRIGASAHENLVIAVREAAEILEIKPDNGSYARLYQNMFEKVEAYDREYCTRVKDAFTYFNWYPYMGAGQKTAAVVPDLTGSHAPMLAFRPPGFNAYSIAAIVNRANNYRWDQADKEWKALPQSEIVRFTT